MFSLSVQHLLLLLLLLLFLLFLLLLYIIIIIVTLLCSAFSFCARVRSRAFREQDACLLDFMVHFHCSQRSESLKPAFVPKFGRVLSRTFRSVNRALALSVPSSIAPCTFPGFRAHRCGHPAKQTEVGGVNILKSGFFSSAFSIFFFARRRSPSSTLLGRYGIVQGAKHAKQAALCGGTRVIQNLVLDQE